MRMTPGHGEEQHPNAGKGRGYVSAEHSAAKNAGAAMVQLPGEVLQVQLEG